MTVSSTALTCNRSAHIKDTSSFDVIWLNTSEDNGLSVRNFCFGLTSPMQAYIK